jgi:hypothetical protein
MNLSASQTPVSPDPKASSSAINRLVIKAQEHGSQAAMKQLEGAQAIAERTGGQSNNTMFSLDSDKVSEQIRGGSVFQDAKNKIAKLVPVAREGVKQAAIAGLTAANPLAGRAVALADKTGVFDKGLLDKVGEQSEESSDRDAPSNMRPSL